MYQKMKHVPVEHKYRILKMKDSYETNSKWTICHYINPSIMSEYGWTGMKSEVHVFVWIQTNFKPLKYYNKWKKESITAEYEFVIEFCV
jgi:hypothetical protein